MRQYTIIIEDEDDIIIHVEKSIPCFGWNDKKSIKRIINKEMIWIQIDEMIKEIEKE